MKSVIILLSLVMRAADVTAGVEAGYSNIRQDTVAGPTFLECGSVPTWINGELCYAGTQSSRQTKVNVQLVMQSKI